LHPPGEDADPLTEVLRNGARVLLAQSVEAETAEGLRPTPSDDKDGRQEGQLGTERTA
jgi:hypothetical protein